MPSSVPVSTFRRKPSRLLILHLSPTPVPSPSPSKMRRSLPRQVKHLFPRPTPSARFTPPPPPRSAAGAARTFSTSRPSRENEAPRSPFSVFVETLKSEVEKDKALQGNVKQLGGEVGQMQDSESMKKAKELYDRARVSSAVSLSVER